MVELIIVDSSQKVIRYPMRKDETVIGRSEDSDIQIDDPTISRYHAKVSVKYFIHDIGSTNGIWKEGKRFKQTTIEPGEGVYLGKGEKYQLRIETGQVPAEPAPARAAEPPGMDAEKAAAGKAEKADDSQVKKMKAQLDKLKGQMSRMKADLEKSKAARLRLEKASQELTEENRFLRSALYPDGSGPDREEPPPEAEPEALEKPETPPPETAPEPVEQEYADDAQAPQDYGDEEEEYEAESGATDDSFLRELLDIYVSDSGLAVQMRESTREDLLFTLRAIQKWGRDVERVTTRVAQGYAGVHGPMETMLPEVEHNITSLVNELLSKGGQARRTRLEEYLVRLRTWYVACLGGYRKALEKWCHDFLTKLSPGTIRSKKQYNVLVRFLGLDELFYWKLFEEMMRNINVPTMMEEFEENAAQAAVEIAYKDQKDPLGKASEII